MNDDYVPPEAVTKMLAGEQSHGKRDESPARRDERGGIVVTADQVCSRGLRWAWSGRVLLGYLAAISGIEGVGKSLLTAWMIARWTRGQLAGELAGEPTRVLIVASEDGVSDTWVPRLQLAGADLSMVGFFAPPDGWHIGQIGVLEDAMHGFGAQILVLEAALDHLPPGRGGENANSAPFVREALKPLRGVCEQHGWAGIYTMHPPKNLGPHPRDWFQSSQAFSAVPRTTLLVHWHPDDDALPDHDRRRVLVRGKGNLGLDPGGLDFTTGGQTYVADDRTTQDREVIASIQRSEVTRDRLLRRPEHSHGPSKVERAVTVIRQELPADGACHPSKPILAALNAAECGDKWTVNEARSRLVVTTSKAGFSDGWQWSRRPPEGLNGDQPFDLAHGDSCAQPFVRRTTRIPSQQREGLERMPHRDSLRLLEAKGWKGRVHARGRRAGGPTPTACSPGWMPISLPRPPDLSRVGWVRTTRGPTGRRERATSGQLDARGLRRGCPEQRFRPR